MRWKFLITVFLLTSLEVIIYFQFPQYFWTAYLLAPFLLLGLYDAFQRKHAIRRNFPLLGHFRYLFEMIRPEINQYFVEGNKDGMPISREFRSIVYQRSKNVLDTLPFGTQEDVYRVGYEWATHSMHPSHVESSSLRTNIGGKYCSQKYAASLLNIAAMSYGALSNRSVLALNGGAKDGSFAHNTGEGGISEHHLKHGGDLIWQIGTGYFGCRTDNGTFCPESFKKTATLPEVKMIELKLSQGAKPGHGGILPKEKITPEISKIRHVSMGEDVISPPAHSSFQTPIELLEFIQQLRELSGAKPVGIKMCLGNRWEFLSLCKAMVKTDLSPDFIAIDGGEGGTGAAPIEFSNSMGFPTVDALIFINNALKGFGLRQEIKLIASGKIFTAFHMLRYLAVGADLCYSARAMMLALGCIQALRCNSNHCPTGVATQNQELIQGLVVSDKRARVFNYHLETINSLAHLMEATGIKKHQDLSPDLINRRVSPDKVLNYSQIYPTFEDGFLLKKREHLPDPFDRLMPLASPDTFQRV